jgi:CubicO group peptidase (beta-lactamase class C family)
MNFSPLARQLTNLLDTAIREAVFPGAVAGISYGPPERRETLVLAQGSLQSDFFDAQNPSTSYPAIFAPSGPITEQVFFDLASLTKPFATLLSILCLRQAKKIRLADRLPDLLKMNISSPLAAITLAQLLGHCSGLAAYKPFYEKLCTIAQEKRTQTLRAWLLQEKLLYPPGTKTVYSDLGYMFLSWIIEEQAGCPFDEYTRTQVLAPLGLADHLFFNRLDSIRKVLYAPTEQCSWRTKTLTGEVHDDNCYALGGVSGHAGLFGDMHGVLAMSAHLLDVWKGKTSHPNYTAADLKKMTKRQNIPGNTWALGFDTPSDSGSSAGRNMSDKSFGHLGFTGTSFWIDPESDLVMVLLTNRVHPSRENNLIKIFRPRFHDTITNWLLAQDRNTN